MNYKPIDPYAMFAELEKASEELAESVYRYTLLDEDKKPLLGVLFLRYQETSKTIAECEHKARADDEYRTHIKGLAVARRDYERCRARYNNLQALNEAKRTQEVTLRRNIG